MSYPSHRLVRQLAQEPSSLVTLLTRFGCTEHPDGVGWLQCPDGVKRHAYFGSSAGEPSAEDVYLTWDVPVLTRTTVVSIGELTGEELATWDSTRAERMGVAQLLTHYGAPRSKVLRQRRLTFNQLPARTVVTRGRLGPQVDKAHRQQVGKALRDRSLRAQWREEFAAVPEPGGLPYELPEALQPAPKPGPPRRRAFAPTGFEPGVWFSWTDPRDDAVYDCQVLAPAPLPCRVWVAGHQRGSERSMTWLARLQFPYGHRGGRTARQASSLDILSADGYRTMATVEAAADTAPLLLPAYA